ncbi:MAG: sensor histidine kinase [Bacteroidales bacterium]
MKIKSIQNLVITICLLFQAYFVFAEPVSEKASIRIEEKSLEDNILVLNGKWAFYWQEFVSPEICGKPEMPPPDAYMTVPSAWNMKNTDGRNYSRFGYASYYLRLYVPEKRKDYSLKIRSQSSAWTCFVNGEELTGVGRIADNPDDEIPEYEMKIARLPELRMSGDGQYYYDILFHISNYTHHLGGMWDILEFGVKEKVAKDYHKTIFWNMLFAGVFLMMMIYHLMMYLLKKDHRSYLYFSLFVFFVLIRSLITEETLIRFAFPEMGFESLYRLSYFATFSLLICLLLFFNRILPRENVKSGLYTLLGLLSVILLIILFTPVHVFTSMNLIFLIIALVSLVYIIFHVIGLAIFRKRRGMVLLMISVIPGFVGFLNDAMYSLEIIHTAFVAHIGALFFVLMQAAYLANESVYVYKKNKELANSLEDVNQNLEKVVLARTNELTEKHQALKAESQRLQKSNQELKELQEFQDQTIRMIVHDMKAPIGAILQLTEVSDITDEEIRPVVCNSAHKMQQLILNLLDVHKMRNNRMTINLQHKLPYSSIIEAVSQIKWAADKRGVSINIRQNTRVHACFDEALLQRVLLNLIDNAVKYSRSGGEINIEINRSEFNLFQALEISIEDNGPGIKKEIADKLFQSGVSTSDTSDSYGLGLHFCKLATQAMHGDISLDYTYTDGARFVVLLPLFCD